MIPPRQSRQQLHWQSQFILLVALPLPAISVLLKSIQLWPTSASLIITTLAIGSAFALLVWILRAATPLAAATGGLFTASLYLWTPGPRTVLWPLLALFVLTFAATRLGRGRKEQLGTAEGKRGRSASQVAANLGVAVIAGIPLSTAHVILGIPPGRVALIAAIAALAEATADTLSSELGQVFGGTPRMLTTLRRVPTGTDGAISLAGTLVGCLGAALVTAVAAIVLRLPISAFAVAFASGAIGLFADSLLGATLERRGWLNNDAVNFLSTLIAAICALCILRLI